ncbi:MAG: hypothetical protein ACRBEQ_09255 [Hyphomonas sp.]
MVGLLLVSCSSEPTFEEVVQPDESLTQTPKVAVPVELSDEAQATRAEILRFAKAGALRSLSRVAGRTEHFIASQAGDEPYLYWDLMRRTGSDPAVMLRTLFDEPPGIREVDGEIWFVWPDLAARAPDELIPEKLNFQERARLKELVGDAGIARLRAGEGYPGKRTAISEDGDWLYFVTGE